MTTKIQFRDKFQKISGEDLAEFENQHNLVLPQDYKDFLLIHNGGQCPSHEIIRFVVDGKLRKAGLYNFYGIKDAPNYCKMRFIGEVLNSYGQFISIGDDSTNNTFLLSLAKNDYGAVYFWEIIFTDEFILSNNDSKKNVFKLASSFTEFINKLLTIKQDKLLDTKM